MILSRGLVCRHHRPKCHLLTLAFELKAGTGFQLALHGTGSAWYHCHPLEALARARRIRELANV